MCVAICGLNWGVDVPTREQLARGCRSNPDGFGWAFVLESTEGRELRTFKTMDAQVAIDSFLAFGAEANEVVAWSFHARIATHGETNLENAHGFQIGDDQDSWMCHNGMLPVVLGKDDPRSDSSVFASEVLPALGGVLALDNAHVNNLVEEYVSGAGSKVVVLTANPQASFSLFIFGEELGYWVGDTWFSNRSCEAWQGTASYKSHTESGYMSRCTNQACAQFVDWEDEVCEFCLSCQTCGGDPMVCVCEVAYVG